MASLFPVEGLIYTTQVYYKNSKKLIKKLMKLFFQGLAEPMFLHSPLHPQRKGAVTYSMTSLLDVTPTILDWFGIQVPSDLTGKSLLPLLTKGKN